MSSNRSGQYRVRAVRHEARARNFRRQADLLYRRDADFDCAGALLYEAAKQCINAVANLREENPGTTGGKVNTLRTVATRETDGQSLMRNWQSADKLHVHADRGNLEDSEFEMHWIQTQQFIDSMLTIYARDA